MPRAIVPLTAFVLVSITDTLLLPLLAASARFPFGATATPSGWLPTGIVAIDLFVARSTTEMELAPLLATYAGTRGRAGGSAIL